MPIGKAVFGFLVFLVAASSQTHPRVIPRKPVATPSANPAVQQWLRSMTLRDRIAQLLIVPCYGDSPSARSVAYRKFQHLIGDLHVGGMIVVNRVVNGQVRYAEPYAMAAFLNRMQKAARVPLIMAADFERGASMRVNGTTKFPHNMAYGATGNTVFSRQEGIAAAREARALGVQWIFAPDADVNNNPDNPIINIRSYGSDPKQVADHVSAYIEGAHSNPAYKVLVTAKHFPGHGDTAIDTHIGIARLEASKQRMSEVELVPFRAAIEHGVDSIMTVHMSVPAYEEQDIPATVSPAVLTGLLRRELKFNGIITTDAMDMQGLSKVFTPGEASVRAIEAGADILLMPPKPEESIRAIVQAIASGRLTRKRIDESVTKLLMAKARLGLNTRKLVDVETINDTLESAEADEEAQNVADHAVTLVRDDKNLIPIKSPDASCMLILAEGRFSLQGRRMLEEMRKRAPKMKTTLLDPTVPDIELQQAATDAAACDAVYVAAFVSVAAYRGDLVLAAGFAPFVTSLTAGKAPVALIALGNPYLLRSFPNVGAYLTTFSTVIPSEVATVKALFGEIAITGHLPVAIPNLAKHGDGIQLPARIALVPSIRQ